MKNVLPILLAISCSALGVEQKTILVLDNSSVSSAEGVTFHLNSPKKHPENPILMPGEPQEWDSLQVSWPGTVLYNAEEKIYRCWYNGLDAVQKTRPKNGIWVPGYAESSDGVHWKKSDLGQHSHNDLPTNRIVPDWPQVNLSLVAENHDRSDPQRRFLSLWYESHINGPETPDGKGLASSPDGKVWKREKAAYVAKSAERKAAQDISQLLYCPEAKDPQFRYIGYTQLLWNRSWDGKEVRHIGLVHGPDPGSLRDAEDPVVLAPEQGIDEELHFATVRKVGDLYVMLFESDRFSMKPLNGDLRIAVSTDGRKFRRVFPTESFLPTGARGMWDENLLVTTTQAMQEVGDELRIYYFGCPGIYRNWPPSYAVKGSLRGSLFYPSYMGLAILPLDRFAYVQGPGTVTTHPIDLASEGLWMNLEGSALKVEAIDQNNHIVAEGQLTEEISRSVYRKLIWKDQPIKGTYRVRIQLERDAKLYSLRN